MSDLTQVVYVLLSTMLCVCVCESVYVLVSVCVCVNEGIRVSLSVCMTGDGSVQVCVSLSMSALQTDQRQKFFFNELSVL